MPAIEDWTMRQVEAMLGAKWKPPPAHMTATRTLYFQWVCDRIAVATGKPCADQWLIGAIPAELEDLERETYRMRMAHGTAVLREMARVDQNSAGQDQ